MEKYRYCDEELKLMENSHVPFAVYQFINKRVITIILSQGFIDLFGFEGMKKEDVYALMDNNMYRDTHPDDMATLGDAAYRFATEGGAYDVIYRSKTHGEYRIIHAYGRHIHKEDGTRLAFIWYTDQGAYVEDGKNEKDWMMNLFKNQLAERSIIAQTSHDYLTGLPSMTYFFELAEAGCKRIREKGKKPVILFTDFNGMKVYNQKYGMEEGDKVLKEFTDKLVGIFTHENCSRFSADHFCIYTNLDKGLSAAEQLVSSNAGIDIEKKLRIRIGMYVYEDENISISAACDRAKMACDSGKNTFTSKLYVFDQKMMTAIENRQYVVENLDKAIKEGWIKVYYQPIIRTANGMVCHEEALSRWIDPVKGFLSPAEFIPALEESNTIFKLDLYVVDSILVKMREQADCGLYLVPQSVNLSRSDFYTCDIVEEVRKRVDEAGIPRDRIVIEITESIVGDDIEYMIDRINRFKELGFKVWMDDYGSGYSSPMILQKVPFDLIKIDMQFVRQLEEGERAKIILTEIVRMAMALGMDTIAEGIETKKQAEFLKDIGCDMLQGYYFCKPIPPEEIIKRNREGIQIGFENPREEDYYTQLGKVNLYNLSISADDIYGGDSYFDTWPMVMTECKDGHIKIIKYNTSFKAYTDKLFPDFANKYEFDLSDFKGKNGELSLNAVFQCAEDGKRIILDDMTKDGKIIQIMAWRVAVNPVTKVSAVMVAVLSSSDQRNGFLDEKHNKEFQRLSGKYEKLRKENVPSSPAEWRNSIMKTP
ncbi:MAG: EAL domain-containing protein [Oribacterium sp.]|nr:EAL domain-containing protein [Oribacterium sp.]MBP3803412.1 EAL domain-containing protein [Oribacterium sp.]